MFYRIILLLNTVSSKYKAPISVAFLICTLTLLPPLSSVQGSKASPYDSGFDHGCDDAGISDPSDRYINQDEKGPSYHTGEFMSGYYEGFDSCQDSTNEDEDSYTTNEDEDSYTTNEDEDSYTTPTQGTTIEDLCNQYYNSLGLTQPCSYYVQGNVFQGPGAYFIGCNLIKLGVSTSSAGVLGPILLDIPCG